MVCNSAGGHSEYPGLVWGTDDIAHTETDKAPDKNSIHNHHVYIQKKALFVTMRVDISRTRGWCMGRQRLVRFICYMPAYYKQYRCTLSRYAQRNKCESHRMIFEKASRLYMCGGCEEQTPLPQTKLTSHRSIHEAEDLQTGETY